jgi:hypothetical protein
MTPAAAPFFHIRALCGDIHETVAKLRLNARPLCAIQARMLQQ